MPRPFLPKAKLRSVKVLVSLTPGEAVAVRKAAGAMPTAVWFRELALRAAAKAKRQGRR